MASPMLIGISRPGDAKAPQHAVGIAVAREDRELHRAPYGVGADAAIHRRAPAAAFDRRHGDHLAPLGRSLSWSVSQIAKGVAGINSMISAASDMSFDIARLFRNP